MKAYLLYRDQDFDLQQPFPPNEQALTQDLELDTLFNAMALGDKFLLEVARKVILSSVSEVETIRYRQALLQDCLNNAALVREIYAIAVDALVSEKRNFWGMLTKYPEAILHRSVDVLQMFVSKLKTLRSLAETHVGAFASEGFTSFFAMLISELSDDYFASIQQHLKTLQFRNGVLISAELGSGNKGSKYVLRQLPESQQPWFERIFAEKPPSYTFYISERDESGTKALEELKDRGINLVANALAQSNDHLLSFFTLLRTELAFYVGCLNLHEQLAQKRVPICFPQPVASNERRHVFQTLYDAGLALTMEQRIVGNTVDADGKDLVIITGANQGGKSTFLRSIGVAQLMMQCGMFVFAESFCANICASLFTHYKRKEDVTMRSGKLDEELSRMSTIVDKIAPNSMLLLNESFAATNEREGSEIARQITSALIEKRIKVFFVTHLYEFAHSFYDQHMANALFLRAERQADGSRTFQLVEREPLQTSYGVDVYHKIFGADQ
jgi:DNA mismatch repair ATPase MutS